MFALILNILSILGLLTDSRLDTVRTQAPDGQPLYMTVYVPPAYNADSVYPALYLLHGIHGNQYSWEKNAHMQQMADSLIANRHISPVVIVMPLCLVHDTTYIHRLPSYTHSIFDYLIHTGKQEFEAYFPYVEQYVHEHYSVCDYAIAGLSAGSKQALNINRDNRFDAVGLFSPVIDKRDLPKEEDASFYWIRGGSEDMFYGCSRDAHKHLNKLHIQNSFLRMRGPHDWDVWQKCIEGFLLFFFPYSNE